MIQRREERKKGKEGTRSETGAVMVQSRGPLKSPVPSRGINGMGRDLSSQFFSFLFSVVNLIFRFISFYFCDKLTGLQNQVMNKKFFIKDASFSSQFY